MRCIAHAARDALRAGMVALLLSGWAAAATQGQPPPPVQLSDTQGPLDAQGLAGAWVDPRGTATLEQALQGGPSLFQPARAELIYSLGKDGALWLHYRLVRGRNDRNGWLMALPMPVLDFATVYQRDARGQWLSQTAGDMIAVAAWPEPGRYPHFRLDLPSGEVRDVYVRIKHLTPANFPVQLISESAYDQRIQIEYLGLGLTFGALMLLIATCLAQTLVYRDRVYAWYALYALVTMLGVTAYTGVAAHLIWPEFGALGDAPQACLAILAAAAALLFVRNLTGISARHPVIDEMAYWAGLAGIVLAAVYPVLDKPVGLMAVAAYLAATSLTNIWIATAGWRRGDIVGAWVLVAYSPFAMAIGMGVLRLFGWLPVSFGTQYAVVVATALQVPLLLVALNIRSRERHGAEIREQALSSQDALTGLLAPHLFHDRLRQVVARHKRDKENAAVVFIDLINYPRIKDYYGSAVAEQSLLRSVIKLRRLLRDVDTVSRIGEARFGLILEGVTSRIAVTDRAARLIAAGLMPLKGLKPDVTLQFHIAAVLLDERMSEAPELADALDGLLGGMSPRTRRPIRFLEPEVTQPAPMESDSSMLESDSGLPVPEGARVSAGISLSRIASRP
ncbi:sensor domain-containing diguanylate cyclase [Caenimonas soli]|uniref:sensor domain-containing diguanylate cyclase n=1 Tax=Caenimonas soli TaxID=2735555 RepID=UPI00155709F8|nr:7TM diverse intracellular signaling domain-containing protein [Caenimonas soli]NPC58903.1 diguanylate cyclase [Caenimonas soli]